jgi:hypothetical protein
MSQNQENKKKILPKEKNCLAAFGKMEKVQRNQKIELTPKRRCARNYTKKLVDRWPNNYCIFNRIHKSRRLRKT